MSPVGGAALAADKAQALALAPVSRETELRLVTLVELLLQWQPRINLIAASTVNRVWTRHVADSLQLLTHAPEANVWIDLGSGAGFPGLVIACALAGRGNAKIHLVESDTRKAAFLREASRIAALPAVVYAERIEEFTQRWNGSADVVTARALAPLPKLLELAAPLLERGAQGLFPKGQDVEAELTEAAKSWNIAADLLPSVTDSRARIVRVRRAERMRNPPPG
jgi:16S rRNA (guanine527-N7)-methyltransferase